MGRLNLSLTKRIPEVALGCARLEEAIVSTLNGVVSEAPTRGEVFSFFPVMLQRILVSGEGLARLYFRRSRRCRYCVWPRRLGPLGC